MCLFCRTWISDATIHNASVTQLHTIFVVWHNEQAQNRRLPVGAVSLSENFHSFSNSRLAAKKIVNGQNASIHQSHRPSFRHMKSKVHPSSPAEKILVFKIKICRQTEHLKNNIRSGHSYSWPVNSKRQMRKGLLADQHTAASPHSMQNHACC